MKKKVFIATISAILGIFISYNIYQTSDQIAYSDLTLANIEALAANTESEGAFFECSSYGCVYDYRYNCTVYDYWRLKTTYCSSRRGS